MWKNLNFKLFLVTILISLSLAEKAKSEGKPVNGPVDKSLIIKSLEYEAEGYLGNIQIHPSAGSCILTKYATHDELYGKPPISKIKAAVSKFFKIGALGAISVKYDPYVKSVSYSITKNLLQKTNVTSKNEPHGINGTTQEALKDMENQIQKDDVPLLVGTQFWSVYSPVNSKTNDWSYWFYQLTKHANFKFDKFSGFAKVIGATMAIKNNKYAWLTVVVNNKTEAYNKNEKVLAWHQKVNESIGLSSKDFSVGSSRRIDDGNKIEALENKCQEEFDAKRRIQFNRYRGAFNHYNIIGELRLMRRFPDVLLQWWKKGGQFHELFIKNNPNAKKILAWLQKAKSRPEVPSPCHKMNHCAWGYGYYEGMHGKLEKTGAQDLNYYKSEYMMTMHSKTRINIRYAKQWTIPVTCNDFGPFNLITGSFLKDKDPRVWKWLLKDDKFGLENISMTTAKYKRNFRVTLMWADNVVKCDQPTDPQIDKSGIGFAQCTNQYKFFQRRIHDYNYKLGVARKKGDGETLADKSQATDLPGDNPKPPVKPPKPPKIIVKPVPVKPQPKQPDDNPKPPPVNPKPHGLTPEQLSEQQKKLRDKEELEARKQIIAEADPRQVVNLEQKFPFLDHNIPQNE